MRARRSTRLWSKHSVTLFAVLAFITATYLYCISDTVTQLNGAIFADEQKLPEIFGVMDSKTQPPKGFRVVSLQVEKEVKPFKPSSRKFLRELRQQNGCFPDILVIGTQKGGTSSFHSWIKQGLHPNIAVPLRGKELNVLTEKLSVLEELGKYSSTSDLPFMPHGVRSLADLIDWYQKQYGAECPKGIYMGEISPNYSPHPFAPERAHALMPQAKIVMILRNPIYRAESAFNMKWQSRKCGLRAWQSPSCFLELNRTRTDLIDEWITEFEEQIEKELAMLNECYKGHYATFGKTLYDCFNMKKLRVEQLYALLEDEFFVGRGIYLDQLMNWSKFYDISDSMLIMSSEELDENPLGEVERFVRFLDLDETQINPTPLTYNHHVRKYPWMNDEKPLKLILLEKKLADFYKPLNEWLFEWVEAHGISATSFRNKFKVQ